MGRGRMVEEGEGEVLKGVNVGKLHPTKSKVGTYGSIVLSTDTDSDGEFL